MTHHYSIFNNGADLAAGLSEGVAQALAKAIAARGEASIAVSGGSTPKAFFQALSNKDLDWTRVTITLVDERFVPPDNERSNHALVKAHLLQNKAAQATFLPLYRADMSPEEAAKADTDALAGLKLPFDVVVLGMGADGHTASFFPGGNNLEAALDKTAAPAIITMEAEGAGEPRLTFNFTALADARLLVLHIEGVEKKAVIDKALMQGDDNPYPIARVIANAPSVTHIFWAP